MTDICRCTNMARLVSFIFLFFFFTSCDQLYKKRLSCEYLTQNYWQFLKEYQNDSKDELLQALNEILRETPRCREAHALRGDILFELGRYNLSEKDFIALARIDTNNIYAYYNLGLFKELESRYDSAIYFYEKAISKKNKVRL